MNFLQRGNGFDGFLNILHIFVFQREARTTQAGNLNVKGGNSKINACILRTKYLKWIRGIKVISIHHIRSSYCN